MTHITVPNAFNSAYQDYIEERYDLTDVVDDPEQTAYLDVDDTTVESVDALLDETGIRHCVVTDIYAPEGLYQETDGLDEDRLIADIEGAIAHYLAAGGPVNTDGIIG